MYRCRNLQRCKQFQRCGGGPKILKVGHVTLHDPFWTNSAFFLLLGPPWPICVPHLKFLPSTVPEIWRRFHNFKSRSYNPFTTSFDLILHFYRWDPQWPICVPNLKFLAWTVPRIWRGSPFVWQTHSLTHSLTNTQTDFINCPMLLTHWADN